MTVRLPFRDRAEAGRALAERVSAMHPERPVVLALPRGGVPVAAEIARALRAPLDLILVRKIGVPWQPELAAAAVVDGDRPDVVVNDDVVAAARLAPEEIDRIARRELAEIERRRAVYLAGRPPVPVSGRTAIVVDDGIATGASMRAALVALGRRGPARIVLAVPVAPDDTIAALRPLVDDIVCLATPVSFLGIGAFYDDFHQVPDREVVETIAAAASSESGEATSAAPEPARRR